MQKENAPHAKRLCNQETNVDLSNGAPRRHLKVTLFFPLQDNDGDPFDENVWRWWQREMQRLSDYTELGIATGFFRGQIDRNRVIVLVVAPAKLDSIREFLVEACSRFRQDAMYFEYHETEIELVKKRV